MTRGFASTRAASKQRLLACSMLMGALVWAPAAFAQPPVLPDGGRVVAGEAVIGAASAGRLGITQSSARAIIDWNGFSIGAGGSVHIDNGAGATLNRVTGTSVSAIDGRLSATGSVWLLNPNGVIIGKDGAVDVGVGFVASTLDLSNAAFMAGGPTMLSGASRGAVVNLGRIGALGGDVVLAALTVENHGTIAASRGTAALLGGTQIMLADQAADGGRFKVLLRDTAGSVTTSGVIEAAAAELRANGGSIHALAGNMRGIIRATGVSASDGKIFLTTGADGTIAVAGSDFIARDSAGAGGTILVGTADTAHTMIAGDVRLDAAATRGAGGFIETSARKVAIADGARITTLGAGGATGTWLIDPQDYVIAASGGDITGALLSSQLASTNIEIQSVTGATAGNGDIFVRDAVSWDADTRLTLNAERDIVIAADITARGANAGLALIHGAGRDYRMAGGRVTLSGANASFSVNGAAYTLIRDAAGLQAMQGDLAGRYALAGDIDASATATWNGGAGFAPVGNYTNQFTGALAGLGHAIDGLTINRPGQSYVGLIGVLNATGSIRDLGLQGGVITGGEYVGGLVGWNEGTVSNAYATGTVSGTQSVGGLVGGNAGSVSNAYATGAVGGDVDVGGLVGWNQGTVSNAYATGGVSGNYAVGGLIGLNDGTVSNAYATGAVSGNQRVGGLVGENYGTVNAYWDVHSTRRANAIGYNYGGSTVFLTAITSDPAQSGAANYAFNPGAYAGFDFTNTWFMANGTRPFLRSEWSTTITNAHQLQLMAMNLGAHYTLARNIDASETGNFATNPSGMWSGKGFAPVGDFSNNFTGSLIGLGHVIDGLMINRPGQDGVGLIGVLNSGGTIRDLGLQGGAITGGDSVGGLVGSNAGTVSNVYATGAVSSETGYLVGGLVGSNFGTVSNAYATGAVSASAFAGGLVGENKGTVSNAYATGAVSDGYVVGGLIGGNYGSVSNAYAMGTVSGIGAVGGLVGGNYDSGSVSNAYAMGAVSGTNEDVGGLIGLDTSGSVSSSYWDTQTSGQTVSAGGIGKTTAEMRQQATFAGWDFATIWAPPGDGYLPELYGVSGVVGIQINATDASRVYGNANPLLTGSHLAIGTGYWNTLTVAPTFGTTATSTSNVGDYAITATGAAATRVQGGAARIIYLQNNATLTITPRGITVTTNNLSRIYGDSNPALGYTLSGLGLVNGDTLSGALATAAGVGSGVGSYAITQGSLAASANYALTFTPGALSITPRGLTVTANDLSRIYGDANPALGYTLGGLGLVNGDTLSGALATVAGVRSGVGDYAITQGSLAASANYALSFTPGALGITQRSLSIRAVDATKFQTDPDPIFGYTLGGQGLVNGDTLSGVLGRVPGELPGSYAITLGSLTASPNYQILFDGGIFRISPIMVEAQTPIETAPPAPAPAPAADPDRFEQPMTETQITCPSTTCLFPYPANAAPAPMIRAVRVRGN